MITLIVGMSLFVLGAWQLERNKDSGWGYVIFFPIMALIDAARSVKTNPIGSVSTIVGFILICVSFIWQ
jgi:hypothetical protein